MYLFQAFDFNVLPYMSFFKDRFYNNKKYIYNVDDMKPTSQFRLVCNKCDEYSNARAKGSNDNE
jgi:hypothetical protein